MILLGMGANLPSPAGPPPATLNAALEKLRVLQIVPRAASQIYVTPAWPNPDEPKFVNIVIEVETRLSPKPLLERLHEVEAEFGRRQSARNAPRSLDIDILDYEGIVDAGPPCLPHPRMEKRAFVLVPLAEIAPMWRHPVSGRAVMELIHELPPGERTPERLA